MNKIAPEPQKSFLQEIEDFSKHHIALCICTLGVAVLGFIVGKLGERFVHWIRSTCGTTKKTEEVAAKVIENAPSPESIKRSRLKKNILEAYRSLGKGWVNVKPKDLLNLSAPFELELGAAFFEGSGKWKVHINIDPNQMEDAIAILVDVLHGDDAPRLGFKIATKALLEHKKRQKGKEVSLHFDAKVESTEEAGACLKRLMIAFKDAGIRRDGLVLTAKTIDAVLASDQIKEKDNYAIGKFDREIPCPPGCNYFNYRGAEYGLADDASYALLAKRPNLFSASQMYEIVRTAPQFAHNPVRLPDPFIHLDFTN